MKAGASIAATRPPSCPSKPQVAFALAREDVAPAMRAILTEVGLKVVDEIRLVGVRERCRR